VVLNETPDYIAEPSTPTPRRFARLLSTSLLRSNTVPRRKFKGGNLNTLHINRAKLNLVFEPGLEEKSSIAKHHLKTNQHHYHSKEEKCNIGQRRHYAHELSA
jgi:hypothetical protein